MKALHTVRQPHSRNSVSQVQPHSRNSVQVLDTVQHKFNPIPRIQCKCQIVSGTSATLIQEFSESAAHCPATPFQEFSVTSATPFQKFRVTSATPFQKFSTSTVQHKFNPIPRIQCKCQIVSGTSATLIQEFSESAGHFPVQVQPHSRNLVQVPDTVRHKCNPIPGIWLKCRPLSGKSATAFMRKGNYFIFVCCLI